MSNKVSSLPIREERLEIDATHVVKVGPPESADKFENFITIATQPERIEVRVAIKGFNSVDSAREFAKTFLERGILILSDNDNFDILTNAK